MHCISRFAFTALIALSVTGCMAKDEDNSGIRVVPVDRSPEPDNVELFMVFPKKNEVKTEMPVHFQVNIDGYPLGTASDFPRDKEVKEFSTGQTIRLFIDDRPYIPLNEINAPTDMLDDHDRYYQQTVEYDYKERLSDGAHVVRVLPAFSFGESLKGDNRFLAEIFYYKTKSGPSYDLKAPFLTYNEPQGEFSGKQPLLLDFYLTNCELSADGYKVRLTIDGKAVRVLTQWIPYYIYGLSNGEHTIKIELIDAQGKLVNGPFSMTERSVLIK